MSAKTLKNPKGAGRKAGVRSKQYNTALQDYFTGGGSVAEIAKKHGIDRSGLNKVINSTNKEAEASLGTNDLRAVAVESKNAVIDGLKNLEALKNSTNPTHNALADNIMNSIYATNLTLAKNIQIIGSGLLKDLHREITDLREKGEMKMGNINKALSNLEIANRIMGIPKAPQTQINIQNNNANINASKGTQAEQKKEIRFVTISSKDDLKKAEDIIESEVIE